MTSTNQRAAVTAITLALLACSVTNRATPTPARTRLPALQDGPTTITGEVAYTNSFFTMGVAQPIVILEDQTGFVRRDRDFLIPPESQVLGSITSDFYESPFTYSISLPAMPNGALNDVDHDGQTDAGVMVFAVAYWTNTWGDPYLERRDQGGGGWSNAYASTRVSSDSDSLLEVVGGKYLVYAPDANQEFPSAFGADAMLFSDDDPLMPVPAGWSMIDLDSNPFSIDRSSALTIDLIEGEGAEQDDFSDLSYTEAFDAMLEKFSNEYAFTELKDIDWEARADEFRPRFERAQRERDTRLYALALRDFMWSIPDTHVGFDQSLLAGDFRNDVSGGLGLAIRELDDGSIVASYVLEDGPAARAGLKWGAEIFSFDSQPIGEVVTDNVPWSSPFSSPVIKRLEQLHYATRFPMQKSTVRVEFQNPGGPRQAASLEVVNEFESFEQASPYEGESEADLPVEFEILPNGYGYLKITSFLDNDVLSIQVWERAMQYLNDNNVRDLVIDMRHNSGGSGWLANQMAGYFFDEELVVGRASHYDEATGEFYLDPDSEAIMIPAPEELRYDGEVAVLVGPACASACEFFAYDMTLNNRAVIVGQYPSEGAGGSVEAFFMPEDIYCQLTIGRAMDPDGKIHLEGKGVEPGITVPVTLETLQEGMEGIDVVLDEAIQALSR